MGEALRFKASSNSRGTGTPVQARDGILRHMSRGKKVDADRKNGTNKLEGMVG